MATWVGEQEREVKAARYMFSLLLKSCLAFADRGYLTQVGGGGKREGQVLCGKGGQVWGLVIGFQGF